jgi:hypothetical protein
MADQLARWLPHKHGEHCASTGGWDCRSLPAPGTTHTKSRSYVRYDSVVITKYSDAEMSMRKRFNTRLHAIIYFYHALPSRDPYLMETTRHSYSNNAPQWTSTPVASATKYHALCCLPTPQRGLGVRLLVVVVARGHGHGGIFIQNARAGESYGPYALHPHLGTGQAAITAVPLTLRSLLHPKETAGQQSETAAPVQRFHSVKER